jgi:hypothetical protein
MPYTTLSPRSAVEALVPGRLESVGKFCTIRGSPINIGLAVLQMSSAKLKHENRLCTRVIVIEFWHESFRVI